MRRTLLLLAALLLSGTAFNRAQAQYYNTGQSPASLQWKSLRTDSLEIIFPDGFGRQAHRLLFYMDTVRGAISHGYALPPLRTPVVIATEDFYSNGLAMLAPRRIEIGAIPAIDTYSEPWFKQLATHEYRHMVQYGNINRSTVKVFSWLFGQQAPLLATGMLPFWFIEGDAVMAETQMSSFGRALQPSFTLHYRALGREILEGKNPDKWFCGSYRDYVPSHYELGFQLVSYADRRYDEYLGSALTRYTSDYPILIFTTSLALRKYYDTNTRKMFRETFSELNDLWDSLPAAEDSPRIVAPPVSVYTKYSYPIYTSDTTLLVLKEDYDRTQRFVEIHLPSGRERKVCYTGDVSTRPVYRNGRVMWTEYRQSLYWERKVDSRLCLMYLGEERYRTLPEAGDGVLYPVMTDNGSTAFVNYSYEGVYSIEFMAPDGSRTSHRFDESVSLHGLAWDESTARLYYIALSDDGMWIGSLDACDNHAPRSLVTQPAYVTISDLSADDGMLYFGSIYSGKDEAHVIDLSTGREYRMSESRYGSFSPSPSPTGEFVALTTYERDGYKAALQEVEYREEVEWTPVPRNVVNAPLERWDVPSVDDVVFTPAELEKSMTGHRAKRYGKLSHLFRLHSWAPLYYLPDMLLDNIAGNTHFGATLISQNLLGTAESSLGYGYTLDRHSYVRARFGYYGWAPKIEATVQWSDMPHQVIDTGNEAAIISSRGNSLDIAVRGYLPILFSSGHAIRQFTPVLQFNFRNSQVIDAGRSSRYTLMLGYLQYDEYVRRARLDLQPRWGYTLRASVAGSPFSKSFSTAWSIYGRAYVPGLFLHHGLTLAATYQRTYDALMTLNPMDLMPYGYSNIASSHYFAAAANYRLPVAYPDWGVTGLFFLKRISLDLSFTYARYVWSYAMNPGVSSIYSAGGQVTLDAAMFRMPSQATVSLSLGLYYTALDRMFFTAGFSVPL